MQRLTPMSSRVLEKKMEQWIDAKLAGNGLAQAAIKSKDARTVFRLANEACVGIREKGANNSGPMVELVQETVGDAEGEPWCMSLQMTCLAYAERKTGIKSPIIASEHCLTVWQETPKSQRVKAIPAPGAIIIWRHGNTSNGHTGCMIEWQDKKMRTIEGNSESGVTPSGGIERDGGGCYLNLRSTSGTGSMKVVGFLKPF